MAENENPEKPAPKKKGKGPLLAMLIVGVVAGGAGFAVPMFLLPMLGGGEANDGASDHGDASAGHGGGHGAGGHGTPVKHESGGHGGGHGDSHGKSDGHGAGHIPGAPAFVPFGQIVVNLDEGRLNRYLRVSLTLQVGEDDLDDITQRVEHHRAILRSWLLSYLSDKGMEDVRGGSGQNRLRREIQDHFNSVLFNDGHDRIKDVLFEEFNVQ